MFHWWEARLHTHDLLQRLNQYTKLTGFSGYRITYRNVQAGQQLTKLCMNSYVQVNLNLQLGSRSACGRPWYKARAVERERVRMDEYNIWVTNVQWCGSWSWCSQRPVCFILPWTPFLAPHQPSTSTWLTFFYGFEEQMSIRRQEEWLENA